MISEGAIRCFNSVPAGAELSIPDVETYLAAGFEQERGVSASSSTLLHPLLNPVADTTAGAGAAENASAQPHRQGADAERTGARRVARHGILRRQGAVRGRPQHRFEFVFPVGGANNNERLFLER